MASTPIILISGSFSGAGTPGEDKIITDGEVITLTDTEAANAGADYQWTVLSAPIGSTVVLVGSTTPAPTFTAPLVGFEGTVLIQCLVDGIESQLARMAVLLPTILSRIPALGERDGWNEGGNDQGWHESMTQYMREVDTRFRVQGMELIETIIPGGATDHVTFSGLDGNKDRRYQIHLIWSATAPAISRLAIRPNGLVSNQGAVWITGGGAAPTSANQALMICAVSENRQEQHYVVDIHAQVGLSRHAVWNGGTNTGAVAGNMSVVNGKSVWTDIATNITSLEIFAVSTLGTPIATGISTKSIFSLYAVRG